MWGPSVCSNRHKVGFPEILGFPGFSKDQFLTSLQPSAEGDGTEGAPYALAVVSGGHRTVAYANVMAKAWGATTRPSGNPTRVVVEGSGEEGFELEPISVKWAGALTLGQAKELGASDRRTADKVVFPGLLGFSHFCHAAAGLQQLSDTSARITPAVRFERLIDIAEVARLEVKFGDQKVTPISGLRF